MDGAHFGIVRIYVAILGSRFPGHLQKSISISPNDEGDGNGWRSSLGVPMDRCGLSAWGVLAPLSDFVVLQYLVGGPFGPWVTQIQSTSFTGVDSNNGIQIYLNVPPL